MSAMTFFFKADGSKFTKGLDKMRSQTKSWSSGIKGMITGAIGVGVFASMARGAVAFGSQMSDLAAQTRTSVKEFMVFRDVSRDAGVKLSILERALRNVTLRSEKAMESNNNYRKSLTELGIDFEKFVRLSAAEKFMEVARASKEMAGEIGTTNNVANILGERAGPALTEVLKTLATEGFDKVAASASIMSDETAKAMDKAEDRIQKFQDSLKMGAAERLRFFSFFANSEESQGRGAKERAPVRGQRMGGVAELMATNKDFAGVTDKDIQELINPRTSNERIGQIMDDYFLTLGDFVNAMNVDIKEQRKTQEAIEKKAKDERNATASVVKEREAAKERLVEIVKIQGAIADLEHEALSKEEKSKILKKEKAEIEKSMLKDATKGSEQEISNLKRKERLLQITKELKSLETGKGKDTTKEDEKNRLKIANDKIKAEESAIKEATEKRREESENKRRQMEILGGSAIATSLARIGGGGNVTSLGAAKNSPAESEIINLNKQIEKNTRPIGGVNQTPEF